MISKIRGTRDILDTKSLWSVLTTIKKQFAAYHFQEIVLPILEPVSLFKRSLGLQTDVVAKEMFVVSSSSASEQEDVICLRPEATASTVRAFVENGIQTVPWKVFTYGSMFRYERPQKGRFREFYQCSIEVIGSACVVQDVQLIVMLDRLFSEKFKLDEYALHINFLGCPDDRALFKQQLQQFLTAHAVAICSTCQQRADTNPLRVFDCKQSSCQELYKKAPALTDCLCDGCLQDWTQVQQALAQLSVSYVHNKRLVRGLDYYNKTVFEFVSPLLGAQSAFCGGGRYDHLVSAIGGKEDQPSVGAAIGIDRLLMVLEAADKLPAVQEKPLYVVMPLTPFQQVIALHMADNLLRKGFTVDVLCDGSVKSMMQKANKYGARAVLVLGEQEVIDGTVTIKDMVAGTQQVVKQVDAVHHLPQ